jgi:GTP cyclohydrolase III
MLDKGRATLAGTNGEYIFNCPLDQQFLGFAGIDPEALKQQLAEGKGDGEILAWINEQAANKPCPASIAAWSALQEQRAPMDLDSRAFFQEVHQKIAPHRTDIATWFDLLDLDDYVSFGGKP